MKMDMCRALSTLYTSVMSVLPDKYGDKWGISGMDLFRKCFKCVSAKITEKVK